jgi:DNA-binding NarL/FixJ family response regulator
MSTIRAALAVRDLLAREGLHAVLERDPQIEVLETSADEAHVDSVLEPKPDVVIVDAVASSPGYVGGIDLADAIERREWETGVILVSRRPDLDDALALFQYGLARRGYLLEERLSEGKELVEAIETVLAGGWVLDPWVAAQMYERQRFESSSPLARLTPREHDVMAEMATGKSNAAIARSLVISKRVVEHHVASILAKLDLVSDEEVSRRVTATLLYLRSGRAVSTALQAEARQVRRHTGLRRRLPKAAPRWPMR